jgi:hypothetical protein
VFQAAAGEGRSHALPLPGRLAAQGGGGRQLRQESDWRGQRPAACGAGWRVAGSGGAAWCATPVMGARSCGGRRAAAGSCGRELRQWSPDVGSSGQL